MTQTIAKRMRNNLKREYGLKVFHFGKPYLAIRIPKKEINEFNEQDTEIITELLYLAKDQVRLEELVEAYIIADGSHVVLNPNDIFNSVFKDELAGKEIVEHDEEPVTETSSAAPVNALPLTQTIEPVQEAASEEVNEEVPQNSDHIEKSDEKIVRKILSDFARRRSKKLVNSRVKSGRRAEVLTKGKRGRYVRYRMPEGKVTDIAVAPTIRAAAMHAKDGRIQVKKSDYREKVRRRRISTLINIVLDTSGSMDDLDKVDIASSVTLALLKDAYQRRDKVSLVTYSGRNAEMVLPFTSSVELAKKYLEIIPFGGTTPLASGILTGLHALHNEIKKDPSTIPIMVLVTDGKANVPLEVGGNIRRELAMVLRNILKEGVHFLVVDMSSKGSDLAKELAEEAMGRYYHPERLSKENLYKAISDERDDVSYFANIQVQ